MNPTPNKWLKPKLLLILIKEKVTTMCQKSANSAVFKHSMHKVDSAIWLVAFEC